MKNIYVICPVRKATHQEQVIMDEYVSRLERAGHYVHYPPRDVPQDDPVVDICTAHGKAMKKCTDVHVFWDAKSTGSHFDLGMAYMLGKPVEIAAVFTRNDPEDKSYYDLLLWMSEK